MVWWSRDTWPLRLRRSAWSVPVDFRTPLGPGGGDSRQWSVRGLTQGDTTGHTARPTLRHHCPTSLIGVPRIGQCNGQLAYIDPGREKGCSKKKRMKEAKGVGKQNYRVLRLLKTATFPTCKSHLRHLRTFTSICGCWTLLDTPESLQIFWC